MNISGIRPSIGFYDYNSIKQTQSPEAAGVAAESMVNAVEPVKPVETSAPTEAEISAARQKQTFGAYDYASTYKPDETFSMKGTESDINSLDVERAVNDMQKDSMLRQYQYFVGTQLDPSGMPQETAQATARPTEDFAL